MKLTDNEEEQSMYFNTRKEANEKIAKEIEYNHAKREQQIRPPKNRKSKREINRRSYLKRKVEIKEVNSIRGKFREKRREKWAFKLRDCNFINKPFEGCERHHVSKDVIACIPKEIHRSIYHNLKTGKGMIKINDLVFEWLELQLSIQAACI